MHFESVLVLETMVLHFIHFRTFIVFELLNLYVLYHVYRLFPLVSYNKLLKVIVFIAE